MALETRPSTILRFGTFEVDVRAGELRKQGKRIKLQEQPFQVLTVLLQRPGEVVTREELRNQNWPADTFVDFDNSLNTAINKLREALGDSADNPRFIETLPRRGYRFIAPVTEVDGTTRGTAARGSAAAWPRSRKIVVTAAIAMLAAGIAGALLRHSQQARRLTEKDTIVLADFTNTTGDPVFDDTLKQGLRVQLEQSPFLNILPDQRVVEELPLMGHQKSERLTKELARDLCQRVGSKAVLAGSIASLGTHYAIGLQAFNCITGEGLGDEQVEADSRERVLKALSEAATSIREKLGESLASIRKYNAPLERATTPSLEALKAYSLGMKTWPDKGMSAAFPFYQRALQLDPNFAMAYARVGMVQWNFGEDNLAAENTRKAYELRANVSEWERFYIEAHYYDRVTGDLEKAAQVYRVWVQTFPRDWVPYNNLASIDIKLGQLDEALQEARQALQLGPDNEDNYGVAGISYILLNRLDEAETVFQQAAKQKKEGEDLFWDRCLVAYLRGDKNGIKRLASSAADNPMEKANLLLWEGLMEGDEGKLRKTRELWRGTIETARDSNAKEWAAVLQTGIGLMEAYFGEFQQARAHVKPAIKDTENRDTKVIAALALALSGDVKGAEVVTTALDGQFPTDTIMQHYWLPTIGAAAALGRKNAQRAVELLQEAKPYELSPFGWMQPVYLRGQSYLMLRNGGAAAMEFQKILDHRPVVELNPVGELAHLGLARAYSMQGKTTEARAAYQDFLTLWKEADPDIPILKQAKAEYAKLQ